jgi:hypothetical protein
MLYRWRLDMHTINSQHGSVATTLGDHPDIQVDHIHLLGLGAWEQILLPILNKAHPKALALYFELCSLFSAQMPADTSPPINDRRTVGATRPAKAKGPSAIVGPTIRNWPEVCSDGDPPGAVQLRQRSAGDP